MCSLGAEETRFRQRPEKNFCFLTVVNINTPLRNSLTSLEVIDVRISLVAVLVFVGAHTAFAQNPAELEVRFEGPLGCPDAESVRAQTMEFLSGARRSTRSLSAEVRVVEHAGTYDLRLVVLEGGTSSVRELNASSCDNAARAAALILAFAIDPERVDPNRGTRVEAESSVGPTADQPVTRELPRETPSAEVPHQEIARPWSLSLSGFATLLGRALPTATGGVGGEVLLSFSRMEIALGANVHMGSRRFLSDNDDRGASFSRWTSYALGGYVVDLNRVALVPRVGLSIGETSGSGVGVSSPVSSRRLWFAPVVGVDVRIRVDAHVGFAAGMLFELPLARPQYELTDLGILHEVPSWSLMATLGINVRVL